MAFVADTINPGPWSGWTFGYQDGLQAWMQLNYAAAITDPDVIGYIGAMSPQPSQAQKNRINTLIMGLKADGTWVLLDYLILGAQQGNIQNATLNAKNPTQVLTAVGGPTFTPGAGGGIAGNGTSSYFTTTFNPFPGLNLFKQNDAHMGVWIGTDVLGSTQADLGTNMSAVCSRTATGWQARANFGAGLAIPLAVQTSVGHSLWCRSGATAIVGYKNAAEPTNGTNASAALVNFPFAVCARNNAGVIDQFSSRRIQIAHWGKNLTPLQVLSMYNRFNTYLTT